MPSFDSQRQSTRGISWSGIRTPLVQIPVLLALGFAVVRYLEWSSDVNQAEFTSATSHQRLIRIIPALPRCTTGLIFPYFDGRSSVPLADIRRPRDTPIWKLEAALKWRWCKKGRYAPPVHMIKPTETREIAPYIWVHPDEKTDEPW